MDIFYEPGGFGGGAMADYESPCNVMGGSGGGYSGGSGSRSYKLQYTGYGGGSFNNGTLQVNIAATWKGNGTVIIKWPGQCRVTFFDTYE